MRRSIAFYFDVISPYAYLAWTRIHALAERHQREVEPVPILFAALLDHFGHKGPAEIAPKRIYVFKNVVRLAHGLGVPLSPPPAHPFNPLLALRIASLDGDPDIRRRRIDALFRAVWGGGPGVTEPDAVARVLSEAGFDGDELVARAQDATTKARLRQYTDAALASGVFGVPTVLADGEVFWGVDALPHVDAFLAGDDPVTGDDLERWLALPVQASRI